MVNIKSNRLTMKTHIFRSQSILAVILFVCIIPFTGFSQAVEEKQINVVFRFDDYSALSSTDIELKIIGVFRKNRVAITFGVIPFVCEVSVHDPSPQDVIPLTSRKGDILKTAFKDGILDIALHGYSHQTISAKRRVEFSGLEYNSQVERLTKGKKFLEAMIDAPITTFIPPWNIYDLNTLLALEELGFSTISAGIQGEADGNSLLNFLPATCDLSQLRDAVIVARSSSDTQPVVVVLFHQFDFLEIDPERGKLDFPDFEKLLAWVTSQKDIRVLSLDQAANVIDDLSDRRFIEYNSYQKSFLLLPPFFRPSSTGVYLSSGVACNMKIKFWMFTLSFYVAVLFITITITSFGGFVVFPRSGPVTSFFKYGGPALLVMVSIYALRDLALSFVGALLIAVLLGACVGVWGSFLRLRKQGRIGKQLN